MNQCTALFYAQPHSFRVVHISTGLGSVSHLSKHWRQQILSPDLTVEKLTSIMDQFVQYVTWYMNASWHKYKGICEPVLRPLLSPFFFHIVTSALSTVLSSHTSPHNPQSLLSPEGPLMGHTTPSLGSVHEGPPPSPQNTTQCHKDPPPPAMKDPQLST